MKKGLLFLLPFFIAVFHSAYGEHTSDVITHSSLADNTAQDKKIICENKSNLVLQVTNKIEAVSFQKIAHIGATVTLENLEISPLRCCIGETGESYGFIKIYNTKLKKETFNAWMFSRHTSLTSLEDVKFDIILLKCF